MAAISMLKVWARSIKRDVIALWIAARDPRVPLLAKLAAAAVAAYALSPIDLIPDFIPVLGYLDDLVILPLGILLAVWLVPVPLMLEFREAALNRENRPKSHWGLVFIAFVWLTLSMWVIWLLWPIFKYVSV